jgi:hypothetical protein
MHTLSLLKVFAVGVLCGTVLTAVAHAQDYGLPPPTYLYEGDRTITLYRDRDGTLLGGSTSNGGTVTPLGHVLEPAELPSWGDKPIWGDEPMTPSPAMPPPSQTLRKPPPGKSTKERMWEIVTAKMSAKEYAIFVQEMAKRGETPPPNFRPR